MANTEWQDFLTIQGAHIVDNFVQHFNVVKQEAADAANSNIICDLSHLGMLEISGIDAATFLQGQVTNDVKLLDQNNAHYTGYCSPKGRLLALFFAYTHDANIYLQMNHALIDAITKRLKMYVLRAKVMIQNISNAKIRIGLSGESINTLLQPFFTELPSQIFERKNSDQATLIRLPGKITRYELITTIEHAQHIWLSLKAHCTPVGVNAWEWLEIQSGIPDITITTQETFVPQMVNLDSLNGISLNKGCYTGQEIVARTHYLGKVKRKTYLGHIDSTLQVQIGADVSNQAHEIVGKIVRVAIAPLSGWDVLAEIRNEYVEEKQALFINGIALEIKH